MLETLVNPSLPNGENVMVESISRKDAAAIHFAAMIDGEGCIYGYFKKQTNPKARHCTTLKAAISVYNTSPLFIRRVTECLKILEVPFVLSLSRNAKKVNQRLGIQVVVEGFGRLTRLLPLVIPYLSGKRKQAEILLEIIQYREGLLSRYQNERGCFAGMNLSQDARIAELIESIKKEKHEYPCVSAFSRKPNLLFGESSETLRLSSLFSDDDKVRTAR